MPQKPNIIHYLAYIIPKKILHSVFSRYFMEYTLSYNVRKSPKH